MKIYYQYTMKPICLVPMYPDLDPGLAMRNTWAELSKMETFRKESCVREYHIYKEQWEAAIGEEPQC